MAEEGGLGLAAISRHAGITATIAIGTCTGLHASGVVVAAVDLAGNRTTGVAAAIRCTGGTTGSAAAHPVWTGCRVARLRAGTPDPQARKQSAAE